MLMIDYDWYEDGVLVEREDFNVNENGPFEVTYDDTDTETGD